MRLLKSFGRFCYDFIIGDDWKIFAGVVIALVVPLAAMRVRLFGDAGLALLGGFAVIVAFGVSLTLDVRGTKK